MRNAVQKQGQVYKIYTKEFPAKAGKPPAVWFSIKLEGDDTYYRCKGNNPGDVTGKVVKFEVVDGDQVTSKPEIVAQDVKPQNVQATQPTPGQMGQLGSTRESSIHYQSARKDALQLVDIITRTGAVKLPAKEAAKLEALEALVDSYTAQYFSDISTFGAVSRSSGEASEAAEAPAADDEE
jgi:hypothetical protein